LRFNAENQATPQSGTVYSYDGDGRRVIKSGNNYYWVDDDFNPLTLTDTSGNAQRDFIFFNGQRVGMYVFSNGNPYYYLADALGSTAVISSGDGKAIQWESDYYPYGGTRVITSNLTNYYQFTGYEKDFETNYYYAINRLQSPNLGRFFSPDRVPGTVEDPQSWNRYGYVLNNPVGLIDRLGLDAQGPCTEDPINGGISCPGTTIDVFGEFFGTGNSDFGYDSWSGGCYDLSTEGLVTGNTCGSNSNQSQQNQPTPGEAHKSEPYSLKPTGSEPAGYGAKIFTYQVVDPTGRPVRDVSVQEHVKVVAAENANIAPNPNPVYYPAGVVSDRIGPQAPPDNEHSFLKTEQTFTAFKNGNSYEMSTKINQYINVTNGNVMVQTVVIVP
jgi:RHS repeat-associated protein